MESGCGGGEGEGWEEDEKREVATVGLYDHLSLFRKGFAAAAVA